MSSTEQEIKEIKETCNKQQRSVLGQISETRQTMAEQGKDISYLKDWQEAQNGRLKDMSLSLEQINTSLHEMKISEAQDKPGWIVTTILTILTSLATGMIVYNLVR